MLTCYMCAGPLPLDVGVNSKFIRWVCSSACESATVAQMALCGETCNSSEAFGGTCWVIIPKPVV